ncbi:MAG TPA: hypothetical protein VLG14_13130 [Sphingomonas sp.]|jgi:hypothetical protein|nr:hypothetical protein [Sphingomonas sp.]
MIERMEDKQPKSERLTWVEPEISTLAIEETAGVNGVGSDGNPANVDCTRS